MKKSFGIIAGLATLAFIAMPGTPAGAEPVYSDDGTVATVKTYGDFDTALKNDKVTTIKLDGDIDATGKTDILHDVTIDGGGHTIKFDGTTDWKSNFLQAYKATATVKDLTVKGGNLAFFVNGGTLNIEGTVNISGNFGGIGLSQGGGVTEVPTLNIANGAVLNYTGESVTTPAIYQDEKTAEVSVKYDGIEAAAKVNDGTGKVYFYFDAANAPVDQQGFTMLSDEELNQYRETPIADVEEPTDPETPDVTEPVDEGKDTEADVTAPNTGATIANIALVVTGAIVAILTAVYATRFASARK